MSIASCSAHLPVVRSAVEKFAELVGFEEQVAGGIVLAVDEALANIIEHAYEGRQEGRIEIRLDAMACGGRAMGLKVELRDFGRVAPASAMQGRDLEEIRPGGLGVHIMQKCMDKVSYRHPHEGGTLLTMVKHMSNGGAASNGEEHA